MRRLVLVTLSLFSFASLTACGSGAKDADKSDKSATKKEPEPAAKPPEEPKPKAPEEVHFDIEKDKSGILARTASTLETSDRVSADNPVRSHLAELSHHSEAGPSNEALCTHVVELRSTAGERRLPLEAFITGYRKTAIRPGELVTAIIVPCTIEGCSAFLKLGARRYLVISIAMVAAIVESDREGRVSQARIAVGACSAVAQRLRGLEQDLVGAPIRSGLGVRVKREHLEALTPIGDVRATSEYRRDAALTLVRRALDACLPES